MATNQTWLLEDTFETWLDKYNAFVELTKTEIKFRYLPEASNGLYQTFSAGQIRNGSNVEDIATTTILLKANSSYIVGVQKPQNQNKDDLPSVVVAYLLGSVPASFFVPIYAFTTDATKVSAFKDMRTPFSYGTGGQASEDVTVMMFSQNITADITILPLKNGLSVGPIVNNGYTVTVSDGSEWAIV